ncbi:hypothetical protein P691DRAFT_822334 [Macrolepiota fuliginosa MF-IS2]|uniref:Uncharacterized protein n=1 Tax=Macrolepiota fuliginosa MF-IS2 TaxID=1400762 RepID=A0A9P6BW13_9AGAR|nr:hypothetical protein P691DRAFT_822334 [Macrolepiota fuliginosa MF-IS2]
MSSNTTTTSTLFAVCPCLQGLENYAIWVRHICALLIKDTLPDANTSAWELANGTALLIWDVVNPNTANPPTVCCPATIPDPAQNAACEHVAESGIRTIKSYLPDDMLSHRLMLIQDLWNHFQSMFGQTRPMLIWLTEQEILSLQIQEGQDPTPVISKMANLYTCLASSGCDILEISWANHLMHAMPPLWSVSRQTFYSMKTIISDVTWEC